jgi:hypothetical protein
VAELLLALAHRQAMPSAAAIDERSRGAVA